MELLIGYVEQGLSFIVPLVILLGLLIFVHEMGHFLVAKYYGVKVETFSLGFGKRIFQFRRGDTDYCLSLIPFGGYVKMYGDDPSVEVPDSEKSGSFLHKPVGQRIAVVLAGPLMNFFFAILLFFIIAMVGEQMIRPVLGDISVNTVAREAGFQSGDTILSVGGNPVNTWNEVKSKVEETFSGSLTFNVIGVDGQNREVSSKVAIIDNANILSTEEKVGSIEGLGFLAKDTQVAIAAQDSPGFLAGLRNFDRIKTVNGTEVKTLHEFERALRNLSPEAETLNLVASRLEGKEESEVSATVPLAGLARPITPFTLGFDNVDLYVASVVDDSPAKSAGIERGDKIVEINGTTLSGWEKLVESVRSFDPSKESLNIAVLRSGERKSFEIRPKMVEQSAPTGMKEQNFALGVLRATSFANPETTVVRILNPGKAFVKGFYDSVIWTKVTVLSFIRLLQNKVSARSIGGPIMIGQLASKTFQVGLSPFLKIMAIISINLFILNLLPVPVLDGGHLVFYTIEALRGAPLSMRKMEIAQQVGLVLLLGLMALAIFNDVTRLFDS